jgi:dihydrolipoamide dehydrogenase
VHVNTKATKVLVGEGSVKLTLLKNGESASTEIEAETLLIAIGVVPNLDGVLSPKMKLELDRGYVEVNDNYESSVPGIYAAGDIIGPPWLAHVATFEAVNAVNAMFGHTHAGRVKIFPGCTYCQPQIASVGLTERAAKEKKLDYKVGKFPFSASGKAVAGGDTEGFVKVISDAKTGEIYGVHILGNEAPELIAEYVLAMNLKAGVADVHHSIHAHPTLSEALMEAAAATSGEAIHI